MIYTKDVENMCKVAKGVDHGPAPIPEEGKWVQAREIKDISGLTHGIGWCAPQQGACKLTLNIKEGIIETPRPLNKDLIKKLEDTLSKDGKKIELYEKINKSLISGFKITIDNHVIDNSLKNKINDLENTLLRKDGNLWN